jgi:hypothetical protein
VQHHHSVVDFALRVAMRCAKGRIVQAKLLERLS